MDNCFTIPSEYHIAREVDILHPARMDVARAKIASPTVLPRVSRPGARCTIKNSFHSFI